MISLVFSAIILPFVIGMFVEILTESITDLQRIFSISIATIAAALGSIIFCYIGAGVMGLMSVLLTPIFLFAGLLGSFVGLKVNDVARDVRGNDEI